MNRPKVVIELRMPEGNAKVNAIKHKDVKELLTSHHPELTFRIAAIDACKVELLDRSWLRINIAVVDAAVLAEPDLAVKLKEKFRLRFGATHAEGYIELIQI